MSALTASPPASAWERDEQVQLLLAKADEIVARFANRTTQRYTEKGEITTARGDRLTLYDAPYGLTHMTIEQSCFKDDGAIIPDCVQIDLLLTPAERNALIVALLPVSPVTLSVTQYE